MSTVKSTFEVSKVILNKNMQIILFIFSGKIYAVSKKLLTIFGGGNIINTLIVNC